MPVKKKKKQTICGVSKKKHMYFIATSICLLHSRYAWVPIARYAMESGYQIVLCSFLRLLRFKGVRMRDMYECARNAHR